MNAIQDASSGSRCPATSRCGFILVAVVVVFAISVTLFGLWAKAAVQTNEQVRGEQLRVQAARLAEAGLLRARAQLGAGPAYDGETWNIPAGVIDSVNAAQVRIRVAESETPGVLRLEAAAEFPFGKLRRAKITKSIHLLHASPGSEP